MICVHLGGKIEIQSLDFFTFGAAYAVFLFDHAKRKAKLIKYLKREIFIQWYKGIPIRFIDYSSKEITL
jgi:hypothetical protein